jgi:H+/gluconate symporter-like permease
VRNKTASSVSKLQLAALQRNSRKVGMAMLTFALYSFVSPTIGLVQESIGSDFNDLGRKLLIGFVLAVAFAIAFTVIKLRLRDKNPPAAFISVTAPPVKDVTTKTPEL